MFLGRRVKLRYPGKLGYKSTLKGWVKEEANLRYFVQGLDEESGLSRKRAMKAQDPAVFFIFSLYFINIIRGFLNIID